MTAYNSALTYNEQHFIYNGSLIISAPSLPYPISIGDVTVLINPTEDYSNFTSVGIVSYDFVPSGVISIQATDSQYQAITNSNVLILNTYSGELSVEKTNADDSTVSIVNGHSSNSFIGEITLEAI
jgi:hypothetical protein